MDRPARTGALPAGDPDDFDEAANGEDDGSEADDDEEDMENPPEVHTILKKRGRTGATEYLVRFHGGRRDEWLPEARLDRIAHGKLVAFNRGRAPAPASAQGETPHMTNTEAMIDPVSLDTMKLTEMEGQSAQQELHYICIRIAYGRTSYLCGLCHKHIIGAKKSGTAVTLIHAQNRLLACFARQGSAAHIFHGWCATQWLLDNPTADRCPVPLCPSRPPPAAALITPTYAAKVGFDLGGVLIDRFVNDKTGFNFLSDNAEVYLQAAAVQGAFDAVKRLVERLGAESVFIISGRTMMPKKLKWLHHNHFFERTGFIECNAYFVDRWPEKVNICLENGITDFVDDKFELMLLLRGVVPHLYLFQTPEKAADQASEGRQVEEFKGHCTHVTSWSRLVDVIVSHHRPAIVAALATAPATSTATP